LVAVVIFSAYLLANNQISYRLNHHIDGKKIWVTGKITQIVKQDLKDPSAFTSQLTRFHFSVIDIDTDAVVNSINPIKPRTINVLCFFDFPAELNDI
jgi:hypothetical protein